MMTLIKQPMYQEDLAKVINHTPKIKQLHGKSVLMIGASGMIGSFLIDTLMAANEQLGIKIKVYAMGRNRQKLEKRFACYLEL
ncbi:MAG: SDR family NAD-dependent epimerase/dehydratase, partial [Enterococcus faecium]